MKGVGEHLSVTFSLGEIPLKYSRNQSKRGELQDSPESAALPLISASQLTPKQLPQRKDHQQAAQQ